MKPQLAIIGKRLQCACGEKYFEVVAESRRFNGDVDSESLE